MDTNLLPKETVIWQDPYDPFAYNLGERDALGGIIRWCAIFDEGVDALFGVRVREAAQGARGKPVVICVSATVK